VDISELIMLTKNKLMIKGSVMRVEIMQTFSRTASSRQALNVGLTSL